MEAILSPDRRSLPTRRTLVRRTLVPRSTNPSQSAAMEAIQFLLDFLDLHNGVITWGPPSTNPDLSELETTPGRRSLPSRRTLVPRFTSSCLPEDIVHEPREVRVGSTLPPLADGAINISRSTSAPILRFGDHLPLDPSLVPRSTNPSQKERETPPGHRPLDPSLVPQSIELQTTATRDADEGWSGLDNLLFGYSGAAMGGLLAETAEIKGVINAAWGTATEVAFGVAVCMTYASLGIGAFASKYRGIPMSIRGRLSAFCARFSTVLFTALYIIATSCHFGRTACVAGVSSAAVVATVMTALWAFEGPSSAAEAVSSFWGRLWRCLRKPLQQRASTNLIPL